MALKGSIFNDTNIRVVAFQDDAVTCDRVDYDKYLENLNEELLKLQSEPTRFIMRKFLDQREVTSIMDGMVSVSQDQNMKIKMSGTMEEVRRALVNIESPDCEDPIRWAKDPGDRWTDRELVAKLNQIGIVADLSTARKNAMGDGKKLELVKKS